MNPKSIALFLMASMLFLASAYAYDPTIYLTAERHVLNKGEILGTIVEINHENIDYYVVKINVGDKLAGLIPLKKDKQEIVTGKTTTKQLFQVTEFLIKYKDYLDSLKESSTPWYISNYTVMSNLTVFLDEKYDNLTLVETTIKSSESKALTEQLKSSTSNLKNKTLEVSSMLKDAADSESAFINKPKTGGEQELVDSLTYVFDAILELDSLILDYKVSLNKLKGLIASDDLDLSTKQSLTATLKFPQDLSIIGNWASYTPQLKSGISSLLSESIKEADNVSKNLDLRLKMEIAYSEIYADDAKLKKDIGEDYSTLSKSANLILSKDYYDKWKNQELAKKFKASWDKVNIYYGKMQYDDAIKSAKEAKQQAISIVAEGYLVIEPKPQPNYTLLIEGLAALLVLVAILYAVRNRKKFSGFLNKDEEDDVQVYNFK
ncbi:MAG: hypothetical protein COT15_00325 [Candidatus Diapherotrites archaeon CG08_land_8_20_14_0_20_34_12]|nr:MAG: hypothetical protein COT15_00325 [Candidatus Diapherotrites archaeon CG08_land_8_20_14_0_20_34_12]